MSAEPCSRCCLLRISVCRNCQLAGAQISICPRSAFIPIRNGRTGSFTIPAVRRLLLLSPGKRRSTSRLRLRSLMARPRHGTRLRNCNHPRPIIRSLQIGESGSRSPSASAWQRGMHRRPRAWHGGSRNLAGLVRALRSGDESAQDCWLSRRVSTNDSSRKLSSLHIK